MRKPFKDLNLSSSFLFAAALSDPDTCRIVLEIILGRKISKVNVKTENNILLSSDSRCVRLDVNARDEFDVNYDIEAQNVDERNIIKRSRYYQAEMDVATLKPGDDFNKLPQSYVIFICSFDPFGRGLYKYTFIEQCVEDGEPLGDETCKIFFNTKGTNKDDVSEELVHFLKYYEDSTDKCIESVKDESIVELHSKICKLKKSREWESGYMWMSELMEREKRKGREEGKLEGVREMLIMLLTSKGDVPLDLKNEIDEEMDMSKLEIWVKLAATTSTIDEFKHNM